MPGFCKAATLDEIRGHNHVLTPGRYVGAADVEDDDVPFAERFAALRAKLEEQFERARSLSATIREKLARGRVMVTVAWRVGHLIELSIASEALARLVRVANSDRAGGASNRQRRLS